MSARPVEWLALVITATICATPGLSRAQGKPCTDLPPVAWDPVPKTRLTLLNLDRIPSAKELYLHALCGARPSTVWQLVKTGEGALIEIPEGLAVALDEATPYLPTSRFMYVRGGGEDRDIIVILFTDGYDGPFFSFDENIAWTREWAERAVEHWNLLPYEFLRRASTWLHDAALFDEHYTVHTELFGGALEISVYESDLARGLASPLGTVFGSAIFAPSYGPTFWMHELGHYLQFSVSGAQSLAYVDDFTGISRRNANIPILGIEIPFFFKERYQQAVEDAEAAGGCAAMAATAQPWGYTSKYARCGEWPIEDFSDTFMAALGSTQKIREGVRDDSLLLFPFARGSYTPERLFDRAGGDDAGVLGQKVAYIRDLLGYHMSEPQDADEDGAPWAWGLRGGDCNDINPMVGACSERTCRDATDCDDGDPCTVDRCGEGHLCWYDAADYDGDGSPDTEVDVDNATHSCPGDDCDSDDATIFRGSVRECTNDCGWQSTSECLGPEWSECAAPSSCECVPGTTQTIPCTSSTCEVDGRSGDGSGDEVPCSLCATKTLRCVDGAWVDPGICDSGTEGVCAAGWTNVVRTYDVEYCGGEDVHRITETCRADCSGWAERDEVIAVNTHTQAEACNGLDDDCDQIVDNGCPDLLLTGTPYVPPLLGGSGGSSDSRSCPPGWAMVGVRTTGHSPWYVGATVVDSVRIICQQIDFTVSDTDSGTFDYELQMVAEDWTSTRLGNAGSGANPRTLRCDAGEVVAGIDVYTGWYVDSLRLRCATLDLQGGPGSWNVSKSPAGKTGYAYGAAPNQSAVCAGIVTGLSTRDGSVIDAIAPHCASPQIIPID